MQAGADPATMSNLKSSLGVDGQHEHRANAAVASEAQPGNYVIANAGSADMFTHSMTAKSK